MAVLSHPPIRASLTRPRLHAILVLDQIRQGRRLLGQLERQAWQAAEDEYYAWHDYNQRLMRLLLSRDEVLAAHLRTTYRPMLVPGTALLDGLKADIRARLLDRQPHARSCVRALRGRRRAAQRLSRRRVPAARRGGRLEVEARPRAARRRAGVRPDEPSVAAGRREGAPLPDPHTGG